jgi:diguanylate cyclase (GGDEF)-like protein
MDITMHKPKTFPILLVEDNPGDARLVQEMLSEVATTEFAVEHVERLAEARERLMSDHQGCVLLDLSLPDANRLEALMQLRAAAPNVPIVILSGLQDELLAVKAVQEGAQDYLIKGRVDGDSLGRSINYAIERKQSETELQRRAMHDELTGLPNRALFLDRLVHAVAWSRRHRSTFSVMFLDLDRFKLVNDSLGEETGDAVLVEVARRLGDILRSTDTAARVGGDEFIVLLEDISDEQQAVHIAERIVSGLELPLELHSDKIYITASIGIVVARGAEVDDPEALLREADSAMYRAKKRGVRCELFDNELRSRVAERRDVEQALADAIENDEFRVLYQPQMDLRSGEIVGVEALVRWDHPERGLLAPADFIWLAEETGLILPIGAGVLRDALAQCRHWADARADTPLRVCVNLSGRQFADPELVPAVRRALAEADVPAESLCLEVTEAVMIQDVESAFETMKELKELGVLLSIDDFGTGYSSLKSLKGMPVDSLKVDRSFVAGLSEDRGEDAAIVTAVVSLAHSLGLTAIAEGVETADQLEKLKALECDLAQGFYFARPRPAAVIDELLGAQ